METTGSNSPRDIPRPALISLAAGRLRGEVGCEVPAAGGGCALPRLGHSGGNSAFPKAQILLILLWFRKKQQTANVPGKLTTER